MSRRTTEPDPAKALHAAALNASAEVEIADSPTGDEDTALLRRFLDGDRDALGLLAERHEHHLLGLARGLVGTDLAVDAVQETWLRVIRHAAGFRGSSSVRTWLWRIAVNRCRDLIDRRRRDARAARSAPSRNGLMAAATEVGPSTQADMDGEEEALHVALGRLPWEQRELLILCHHRVGGHRCAAEVLGIPEGTVKSRVHSARQALREELTR